MVSVVAVLSPVAAAKLRVCPGGRVSRHICLPLSCRRAARGDGGGRCEMFGDNESLKDGSSSARRGEIQLRFDRDPGEDISSCDPAHPRRYQLADGSRSNRDPVVI